MTNAPFYSGDKERFRSQADSSRYNKHVDETLYDITELFNIANEQEREIERMRGFFAVGSHFAQEQMDQMKRELQALQENVAAAQRPGKEYVKYLLPSDARPDTNVDEYERALIDLQHDIITLPFSAYSSSKLYIHDDINSEYIVPNTLRYEVTPKADGITIKENDFMDALTPDENKFWHRTYTYFSGAKDYAEAQVTIELPDDIISNRDVNTMFLHPYPLNTMDILNVEYQLDAGWKTVPGFKPVENAGNIKLCFPPIEIRLVRVTLRQRHFVTKGNQHTFHMGIREIGVSHSDYQLDVGRFELPVSFGNAFQNKEILDIQPVYQNEDALSVYQKETRLTSFKVYEVGENGKERYLNDTFPIQVREKKIIIRCLISFDPNTRTAPALKGVELTYKGDS